MTVRGVWDLQGTARQQQIVGTALDRCSFPFDSLAPGLLAATGRTTIPVEWADLSVYAGVLAEALAGEGHPHVHGDDGDKADIIASRDRVLGLAWYSGRVSIERTLEGDPELAGEVFHSEGAHMIDFFLMSDVQRVGIWNALHGPTEQLAEGAPIEDGTDLGHGHGWFDVGGYYSFVGEAFMGAFVKTYTTYAVTMDFDHPTSHLATYGVRNTLTPYFLHDGLVHEPHSRYPTPRWFTSAAEAAAAGYAMCPACTAAEVARANGDSQLDQVSGTDTTVVVDGGSGKPPKKHDH